MCKNTHCHFSITDIINIDEDIDTMLFCSYHDCLPEDTPTDCDASKAFAYYTDAMIEHVFETELNTESVKYDDDLDHDLPF